MHALLSDRQDPWGGFLGTDLADGKERKQSQAVAVTWVLLH